MAFGRHGRTRKEQPTEAQGTAGASHAAENVFARPPAVYDVLGSLHAPKNCDQATEARCSPRIRRILVAHEQNAERPVRRGIVRIEGNDYRFLGSGVRVYKGQQAFAHRAKNQIEIESLEISTCFAVVFVNTTKKYAGLVRFFGDEQEGLLQPFLRNALRNAGIGDSILLEIHGGAPIAGQSANADRRSNVLRTLDHLAKNGIDPKAPGSCASPIDISFRVRWIDDDGPIDLRVSTWTGSVTSTEGRLPAARATEKRLARKTAATPMPKARLRSIPGKIKLSLPWTSHLEEDLASPERVPPTGGYVPDLE